MKTIEQKESMLKQGDTIRIYAYPGTFNVSRIARDERGSMKIYVERDGRELFWTISSSIVEINGQPFPLESAPLNYPASDYPHVPMFDYDDGPQSLMHEALEAWEGRRAPEEVAL